MKNKPEPKPPGMCIAEVCGLIAGMTGHFRAMNEGAADVIRRCAAAIKADNGFLTPSQIERLVDIAAELTAMRPGISALWKEVEEMNKVLGKDEPDLI